MAKQKEGGRGSRVLDEGLTYQACKAQVELCMEIDRAAFIWGPPGVGKSAMCEEIAESRGLTYVDIRMSLLNPVDLRGIPIADLKTKVAEWLRPSFIPLQPGNLINFDELNVAPPTVQAAAYQFILDRRCGEFELPAETFVVACGNRDTDKAVLFEMPAPLRNRMIHLGLRADLDDWKTWAYKNGIHPLVIGFLNHKEEALHCFDPESHTRNFPTPRSWEFVSDICNNLDKEGTSHIKLRPYQQMVEGCISSGHAMEFLGYVETASQLPDIESIVLNGATPECPKDPGVCFALSSGLVYKLVSKLGDATPEQQTEGMKNVLRYITFQMQEDFGVVTSKDMGRLEMWDKGRKMLATTKEIRDWVKGPVKTAL